MTQSNNHRFKMNQGHTKTPLSTRLLAVGLATVFIGGSTSGRLAAQGEYAPPDDYAMGDSYTAAYDVDETDFGSNYGTEGPIITDSIGSHTQVGGHGVDGLMDQAKALSEPELAPEERAQQIYLKNISRVKRIKQVFGKLRQQVELMDEVHQLAQPMAPSSPIFVPFEQVQPQQNVRPEPPRRVAPSAPKAPMRPMAMAKNSEPTASDTSGADHHVVARGETLSHIARQYLGSAKKATILAKANGISVKSPLKIGQKLRIPGHATLDSSNLAAVTVKKRIPRPETAPLRKSEPEASKSPAVSRSPAVSTPAPAPVQVAAAAAPTTRNSASSRSPVLDYSKYHFKMYVVKKGDTLETVKRTFYQGNEDVDAIDLILRINHRTEDYILKPGDKLIIPLPKS